MKVRDIFTKDPEVINPESSVAEAANKMRQADIGMLPVCENDRLIGSITDRDIAIRCVAEERDALGTKVRDVMSPHLYYCFDDQDLKEVALQMEDKHVRRLPVLNRSKRLIGIVSLCDFAVRAEERQLAGEILEEVAEPSVK